MSDSTADRILDMIDAGLQTPVPDPTYGEVSPKRHDRCARCERQDPAGDGDLCGDCRAFLLGDSDTDPATPDDSFEAPAERFREAGIPVPYTRVQDLPASTPSIEAQRRAGEARALALGVTCGDGWWRHDDDGVSTAECLVCGSPVARVTTAVDADDTRFLSARPWPPPLRVWLSPCGHTTADTRGGELYRLMQHPIDRLGDVMWWASKWADYWRGDDCSLRPPPSWLAEVTAEADMVTLIDHDGQVVDRLRHRPAPGTIDVLRRPGPVDLTAMTLPPHEEYRRERGGIYRRTR